MIVGPDISDAETHTFYMYAIWQVRCVVGHLMSVLIGYRNLGRKDARYGGHHFIYDSTQNRRPVGRVPSSYG